MKYKHYVFDVDGTLLDNESAVINAWKATLLEIQNKVYETNDLIFTLGIPSEVSLQKLGIKDTVYGYQVFGKYFSAYSSNIQLFGTIKEVLEELHESGIKLGIVTSKTHSEFDNDIVIQKIANYFDTIVCVTDSLRPKPFADPILTYLEKANIASREAIYIGDTVYDYQCARNAGVDFGLAMWGNSFSEKLNANFLLKKPMDILEINKP